MTKCPFCKGKLVGNVSSKICENIACGAYEVDTSDRNSYDKKLSKQDRQERLNVNS